MEHETLSLGNMCGGAIEEVFQRELESILLNIGDVNTDAEAKRKIILEFTFMPFEDRSGAQVTFACKSKTVPADTVSGTVFLQRRGTTMVAIPHDPRQNRLFDEAPADAGNNKAKAAKIQ